MPPWECARSKHGVVRAGREAWQKGLGACQNGNGVGEGRWGWGSGVSNKRAWQGGREAGGMEGGGRKARKLPPSVWEQKGQVPMGKLGFSPKLFLHLQSPNHPAGKGKCSMSVTVSLPPLKAPHPSKFLGMPTNRGNTTMFHPTNNVNRTATHCQTIHSTKCQHNVWWGREWERLG